MPDLRFPSISVARHAHDDLGHVVVWVRGEHDFATRRALTVAIARAAQRSSAGVLVDLSMVTFMDAAIVGAIVGSRNRLLGRGQVLELRSPSAPARRVLELCGLTDLVQRVGASVQPPRAAPALGSWVDVPSLRPIGGVDRDVRDRVVRPMRANAGTTVEGNRGGP